MPPPPHVDDPTILDTTKLWRRLSPLWVVSDGNGGVRISSAAFDDSPDGSPMSVLISDVVAETQRTAATVIAAYPGYGLAEITAGAVRNCRQGVMRTPELGDDAHASVFGAKTKGNKRAMAKAAIFLIRLHAL